MTIQNTVDVNGITYTYERQNDGARIKNSSTATGKPFSVIELPPEAVEMLRKTLNPIPVVEKKKPGRPKKVA